MADKKRCDLHTHSNFSDGTYTPTELVKKAKSLNISALALTDHNTTAGLKEFMEAGKKYDLITVPGCEFSTEFKGKEVHMVGLFFSEKYWAEVDDFLELMHLAKRNSNIRMIENLQKRGYDVSFEEAMALTDGSGFNRAHVARLLLAKGYVESVKQAFDTLLKDGNGIYSPARKITSIAAIRFIKTFRATAIMAHPLLNLTYNEMLEFLPEAKEAGLDAIETRYTEFDEEMTNTAESLIRKFDLLPSGGSDFHGDAKPGIHLGTGRGKLFVPYEYYEDLKARSFYEE
ncbi:MAG: PHP domain-containing protein [Erysipelotrichaceae bacterium]|nr:PHP domain-containing protein [Erysipelotrichaceae bacterium]